MWGDNCSCGDSCNASLGPLKNDGCDCCESSWARVTGVAAADERAEIWRGGDEAFEQQSLCD
ncbi:hypothetical protein SDJN02_18164 [Cucurbita argyrosperma subsp. argyrosperma]|nr:hypothetical protein SDJN02_18164 [Cucurbita argyrosperma subsp. argyrosperma]